MDNAGTAIVDFGRFVTGFLVVMGIGTCCPENLYLAFFGDLRITIVLLAVLTVNCRSPARNLCALSAYKIRGYGYEYRGRLAYLQHDHQFYNVLPGRGGVLDQLRINGTGAQRI